MMAIASVPFGPTNIHQMFIGVQVPDPITFVVGSQWLNRNTIYPRQGTLLKIIFLRSDLLTEYDHAVIDEWEENFRRTGNNGIVPGVRQRIAWLRGQGAKWFREVMLAMGRRAGKGHITALAQAYVIWNYMAKGDPQAFYGVDRDKRLASLVFAGKRDQAKTTVFGDMFNVITSSECFAPFISEMRTERLSIYAPHDFVRKHEMARRGQRTLRDMATFEVLPKESTPMAGRGPTSFSLSFDEMAHVTASGTARSADEVYNSAKPSTDQFGIDAFVCQPSSPWQMMGKFYENCMEAIAVGDDGQPMRPNWLLVQLASWDIYKDWERSTEIPMFPEGFLGDLGEYADDVAAGHRMTYSYVKKAVQVFDAEMEREKASNPEMFAVERESHWATALDAYFNPSWIEQVFEPWLERPPKYGPPQIVEQVQGLLIHNYKGHADPSKVNDKFGYALAHVEVDNEGRWHAVFDRIGHFDPADFPDHTIDYEQVDQALWDTLIKPFWPDEFTFDQYNSGPSIQRLSRRVRDASPPKRVNVFEKTATRPYDWQVKENTKASMNLGLVHAPFNERLRDELRFMQLVNGRVDHPSAGPVQSKDIADCFCEVVHTLIGEQTRQFILLGNEGFRPGMAQMPAPFERQMGGPDGMGADPMKEEMRRRLREFGNASRGMPQGRGRPTPRGRH